jgi:CBS domain-containing protein
MDAEVGDEIVIDRGAVGGAPPRRGEVLEVRGEPDATHYLVRWDDNGHETLFFPGPDAHAVHLGAEGGPPARPVVEEAVSASSPVRLLLHRPVVTVHPEDPLLRVAQILGEETIGAVVVRGPHPSGARGSIAAGLVSERDVVQALADALHPGRTLAQDVMTTDLLTIAPDTTIAAAAQLMLDNEVRHLPVLEGGVAIGVVSERDVVRVLAAGA